MSEDVVSDRIIFNMMLDLRKKELDPFERAKIIQDYMKKKKISQRELGKQLGIPHSTIADWCRWNDITEKEYEKMRGNGFNNTDVYRILRNNIARDKSDYFEMTKFDYELKKIHNYIKKYIKNPECSNQTESIINELRNDLNRLLMYVEKNRKQSK